MNKKKQNIYYKNKYTLCQQKKMQFDEVDFS